MTLIANGSLVLPATLNTCYICSSPLNVSTSTLSLFVNAVTTFNFLNAHPFSETETIHDFLRKHTKSNMFWVFLLKYWLCKVKFTVSKVSLRCQPLRCKHLVLNSSVVSYHILPHITIWGRCFNGNVEVSSGPVVFPVSITVTGTSVWFSWECLHIVCFVLWCCLGTERGAVTGS